MAGKSRESKKESFPIVTDETFVWLLAIGYPEQTALFCRWTNYMVPQDHYAVRILSKPDKNNMVDGAVLKIYHKLIALPIYDDDTKRIQEFLQEKKPLIVTTDLHFPDSPAANTRRGIEFILQNRHLSPESHYLFHAKKFTEEDKHALNENGFTKYFEWWAPSPNTKGLSGLSRRFPEDPAEELFLEIMRDYAKQIKKE